MVIGTLYFMVIYFRREHISVIPKVAVTANKIDY